MEHDEECLLSKGWTKQKGVRLNHEMINHEWEYSFWEDETEFLEKDVTWYQDPHNDWFAMLYDTETAQGQLCYLRKACVNV